MCRLCETLFHKLTPDEQKAFVCRTFMSYPNFVLRVVVNNNEAVFIEVKF